MVIRPLFATPDMADQGRLLQQAADLVDAGRIHSTATETVGTIDAATLVNAHCRIERGTAHGKIVLEGF